MKTKQLYPKFLVLGLVLLISCRKDSLLIESEQPKSTVAELVKSTNGDGTLSSPTRVLEADNSLISADGQTKIQIKIWSDYGESQGSNSTYWMGHESVVVDPDFVLVGGGARVTDLNNANSNVNALLYAAYPVNDNTFSTFSADSKDHIPGYNYKHNLWVYAIGMKVFYFDNSLGDFVAVPSSTLKGYMNISTVSNSSPSSAPSSFAYAPSGYTVLSGGAKLTWTPWTYGRMLCSTGILNTGSNNSFGKGKDHVYADPGYIETYSLSMQNINPHNTAKPLFTSDVILDVISQTTNSVTHTTGVNVGYLLAGVGASTTWVGSWGRLLYAAYPQNGTTGVASSKDHVYSDIGGTLTVCVTGIKPY
ncbi:MAG: hypothetical protein IM584_02545 [Chitinophagaceae bacterium]|nr:hypothetical protein [Chitinophagaceae bacterium]MCA6451734.1 hypothetical protein [Chitinophagaceae bacterium]MCA6454992.1 hypothetical protein [Chitinophagaceae bacterium]MCA6459868.1 hypothetical protein [Chitinophagaceae bacterium]MCA6465727.1 hypothetical protein [Chitinophagaceae bacterium]